MGSLGGERLDPGSGGAGLQGGRVAGEDVLPADLALFDLRDAAFGDAHAVGDSALGQAAAAADLGEPVPEDLGEEFLLAGLAKDLDPKRMPMANACRGSERVVAVPGWRSALTPKNRGSTSATAPSTGYPRRSPPACQECTRSRASAGRLNRAPR
jgi:hypothetical protein